MTPCSSPRTSLIRGQLKCDGTRADTRFCLSAKRRSPFKSADSSVQSTTGSRGVRISSSNVGYTMFRGSVKGTGYPRHSPVSLSLRLPCVTVCHHISTGVCLPVLEHLMSPLCSRVSGVTKDTAGVSVWPKYQTCLLYRGSDVCGSLSFTFCLVLLVGM